MKTRNKVILISVITVLIISVTYNYYQKQKRYEEYANEKLNYNFYQVCDYIIDSNVIIGDIIRKEYVLKTDLESLESRYFVYLRSLDEINNISKKFYEFNFFSVDKAHNLNREYSNFYYRIDDLLKNREYDVYSIQKYQLDNNDLAVIKESYEYTLEVVKIIKDHIEYYNMFDIVIIEDEVSERIQLKKEYKEEYLEPWPDNRTGGGAEVSLNEDGTVTETPIEVPKYNYPEKPFLKVSDKEWINVHKNIYLINIDAE